MAITAAIGCASSWAIGATATVSVNGTQVGVTPLYLGYNMGHYMSGSNTSAWTQYNGANGYRVWANASDYEPSTSNYGDSVTTVQQFDADKSAVRASPESNSFIPWSSYNASWGNVESGRNKVQLNYVLPQLQQMGVEPVLQLSRSTSFSYVGWGGRWEQWKFYYTTAFWAAKNYDVQRYQMYNEPDISSISQSEWLDRMHVASDAVKSAIEDVNRIYNKQLSWSMNAPVAASTVGSLDTWGKAALNSNRTDYEGNPTNYDIFDTYDVHRYNSLGSSFASDQQTFDTKIPTYNASGQNLPITYTEFNRYTSGTFNSRSDDLDTPQIAAEFGSIIPGAMSQDVYGMYAFKFGRTLWDADSNSSTPDVPQKTGFHYVEDSGTYGIKGATRGAEVMRLAIRAFKGQRPRLSSSVSATNTNYAADTSFDQSRGMYYYYATNRDSTNSYTTTIDLSGWNVAAGQVIGVQEVSAGQMGAVSQYLTVPANKIVSYTQPISSVTLLSIPSGAQQTQIDLNPTADAFVAHLAPTLNQSGATATTSTISRSDTDNSDNAAYMKFNLGSTSRAKVGRAFLNVTGVNAANSTSTILHVYGILNSSWTETGITWNNAPDLVGASDAKLANVGSDAFPVGELTWNNSSHEWGIDVTDFVRQHPDASGNLSFVLIREQRFLGDADTSQIQINTREAVSGKPQLSLFTTANAFSEWHVNGDGSFFGAANWDAGSAPSGAGSVALLGDFVTAPHTVTFSGSTVLGELRFDGLNGYTLSGSGTLFLDGGSGAGSGVTVYRGTHVLDAAVSLSTAANVNVGAGGVLTMSRAISGAGSLTKSGAGTLVLGGTNSFGAGTALNVTGGTLSFASAAALGSSASVALGGGNLDISGNTTVAQPLAVSQPATMDVHANNVSFTGAISGSGALTKLGTGTLSVTASNASFSGGWNVNAGTLRVTANDGTGSGPVVVSNATLRLANVTFASPPALTLNNGAVLQGAGTTRYLLSGSPAIDNGTSTSPVNVTIASMNAGDNFSFGSALRSVASGASFATINVNPNGEAGAVVLNSGGISSSTTYAGDWTLGGGYLQMGPTTSSSSEALNALGFKNGDGKQANAITVNGGALLGAVNAPQSGNVGNTPTWFRAGVTLSGGAIGSTGLNTNFGGNFATVAGKTSSVLVYDPLVAGTPRDVNLVSGAAGSLNNAPTTRWAGTLVVTAGALSNGGAFNINRDGGTITVTSGASLQVNAGATVNLGGAADALSDGVRRVNVLNDAGGAFNVTAGVKNVGAIDGSGNSSVAAGATMIVDHVQQGIVTANGSLKTRDSGTASSLNIVSSVSIGSAGQIDLRNNGLIVHSMSAGAWNGTAYDGVASLVSKGRNGGAWNGLGGIVTSQTAAASAQLTTLAVATAGDVGKGTFFSTSVASTDALVMYTYAGDLDLDGAIDGDDYFRIDAGFGSHLSGYANGDINYDGKINADDYFLIDQNYNKQGSAFGAGAPLSGLSSVSTSSVQPVPEPAAGLWAGLLAFGMTAGGVRGARRARRH